MWKNVVKLKAFGKSVINRGWKKIVIALVVSVLAGGLFAYCKRCTIIIWHLQANTERQERVISQMLEEAKPIIERELEMSFTQKVYSQVMGNRDEEERQTDALADVRTFVELGFKNRWLRFKDVHNVGSINGFPLNGFDFALDWNRGNAEEVLVAFNISYLKRKVDNMQINEDCSFFTELRSYIETKAREN